MNELDGIILAVAHQQYKEMKTADLLQLLRSRENGVVVDVKSILDPAEFPNSIKYWRL